MGLDICHAKPSSKINYALDYFTVDELNDRPTFLTKYKHLLTEIELEKGELVKVLFFVDVAVQRSRMNKDLVNEFENCRPYFDVASVKRARNFLEARPGENQAELEENFKKNFVDNFIEGESVFYMSW